MFEDCQNPDILWLGVFPDDLNQELLEENFYSLKLTKRDEMKLNSILKRPYFNLEVKENQLLNNPGMINFIDKLQFWKEKIVVMKESQIKAEIEALYENKNEDLIDYIFRKLFLD